MPKETTKKRSDNMEELTEKGTYQSGFGATDSRSSSTDDKSEELCEHSDCIEVKPMHIEALPSGKGFYSTDETSGVETASMTTTSITWTEAGPLFRGPTWKGLDAAGIALGNPKIYRLAQAVAKRLHHQYNGKKIGGLYQHGQDLAGSIFQSVLTHMEKNDGISAKSGMMTQRSTANGTLTRVFSSHGKSLIKGQNAHTIGEEVLYELPKEGLAPAVGDHLSKLIDRENLEELKTALQQVKNANHRLGFLVLQAPDLLEKSDIQKATGLAKNPDVTWSLLQTHWYGQPGSARSRQSRRTLAWIFFCEDPQYTSANEWRSAELQNMERGLDRLTTWKGRCILEMKNNGR